MDKYQLWITCCFTRRQLCKMSIAPGRCTKCEAVDFIVAVIRDVLLTGSDARHSVKVLVSAWEMVHGGKDIELTRMCMSYMHCILAHAMGSYMYLLSTSGALPCSCMRLPAPICTWLSSYACLSARE